MKDVVNKKEVKKWNEKSKQKSKEKRQTFCSSHFSKFETKKRKESDELKLNSEISHTLCDRFHDQQRVRPKNEEMFNSFFLRNNPNFVLW